MEIPVNAGLEAIENEDPANLNIPRRQIIQPTTKKLKELGIKGNPGQFLDAQNKVVFDETEIVILKSTKSRLLMPPYGQKDNKPRCFSEDGVVPAPRVEHPLSPTGLCKDCEFAKDDEQINLLCYDVKLSQQTNFPQVFWFTTKKSSLGIVKAFLNGFRTKGKSAAHYIVTMGTEPGKSDRGNFYVVTFKDLREVPEDMKSAVAVAYHMYSGEKHQDEELAETQQSDEVPF